MNEKQAFAAIRNQLRLENLSNELAVPTSKMVREVYAELTRMLRALPAGSIERELRWRQMRQQVVNLLLPANEKLRADLMNGLMAEAPEQYKFAADFLSKAERGNTLEAAAAALPTDGLGLSAEGAKLTAQISQAQVLRAAQDAKVLGKSLERIFAGGVEESAWIRDNFKLIDRVVKTGFLTGQTNDEIAAQLPLAAKKTISNNKAIARTAVMSMSQQAHDDFWGENDDVIAVWEFDATFDYRVCPQCAPWDGETSKTRAELPEVPVHPNCRCRIIPVTEFEMDRRRRGVSRKDTGTRAIQELVKEKPVERAGVKVYKRKVKGPDGKMYWKVAKQVPARDGSALTMGGYLERANAVTRRSVLGGPKADRFQKLLDRGETPEEALRQVTVGTKAKVKG